MWFWRSVVFILSLQALLLPIYGPWCDPLFAGRIPNHTHIYFGIIEPDHHHPGTNPNEHPPQPFAQYLPQGVVNLPATQAVTYGSLPLLPLNDLSHLLPLANSPLFMLWQIRFVGCVPPTLPQPDIPPRHSCNQLQVASGKTVFSTVTHHS